MEPTEREKEIPAKKHQRRRPANRTLNLTDNTAVITTAVAYFPIIACTRTSATHFNLSTQQSRIDLPAVKDGNRKLVLLSRKRLCQSSDLSFHSLIRFSIESNKADWLNPASNPRIDEKSFTLRSMEEWIVDSRRRQTIEKKSMCVAGKHPNRIVCRRQWLLVNRGRRLIICLSVSRCDRQSFTVKSLSCATERKITRV